MVFVDFITWTVYLILSVILCSVINQIPQGVQICLIVTIRGERKGKPGPSFRDIETEIYS